LKRILLLEFCFLFLATTFQGDRLTGWVQQTIPRQDLPVVDLQFLDSLNGFIVLLHNLPDTSFVLKTTNGGNNWTTTQFDNMYSTSIQFVDNSTGYLAGRISPDGIIKKTTNGGINWFTVSTLPWASILRDICFANKDTGWVCSNDLTSGGLWRTLNGGLSWQLQLDYNYRPSKVFFVNINTGWVIGNSGQYLYKTTNCGGNWNLQTSTSSEFYRDVFFATSDTGWIVKNIGTGQYSIIQTTNGGNNWFGVNSPIVSTSARLFFIDNKKGWAGDAFNRIVATLDGFNWGIQISPRYTNYNVSFVDTVIGWAGASGLVHTSDGGGPIVSANQTITEVPKDFVLEQNYPNPFNSTSNLKFKIANLTNIKIVVYDIMGREIQTLLNGKYTSGTYECRFDGSSLSSGIYLYALFADGKKIDTKRMVLIK